jgi:acetolactate synthase-1/2/3 large subunit
VVFGIPGVHTLALYDALYDHPRIRHVTTRHEQGAGFMADGYARASGRVGVALTTTGPAAVNALTPIGEAHAESSPVLLICSGPTDETKGADAGVLHDMRDQFGTLFSVTGQGQRVSCVEEIPGALAEGFEAMKYGRPRPFVLEVPLDVFKEEADVEIAEPAHRPPQIPDDQGLDAAAALIQSSSKPMLIAGGGTQNASDEVVRLAEKLGIPVAITANGQGTIPADHPLLVREKAMARCLNEADVVIAAGTRLGFRFGQMWQGKPEKLIHLDIDPAVIGRKFKPDVALIGDAGAGLKALNERLDGLKTAWDLDGAGPGDGQSPPNIPGPFPELLGILRETLDRDAVVVNDMTMISYQARRTFPVYKPRTFLSPAVYGTLGFSMPAAVGAKIACPDRQVVSLCGDGGFMYTATELSTAYQQGVSLPIILCNDNTYSAIKRAQDRESGGRHIAVELANPDFVMFGKSFGMAATRVSNGQEFGKALEEALQADGPTLIEVNVPEYS